MKEKQYCVVIGDLVASKKFVDRQKVQEKYKKIIRSANLKFAEEIAAPFIITRGDEIASVLNNIIKVNDIVNYFIHELYPVNIRFGIGVGPLTTNVESVSSAEIDGPGFYYADEALQDAKKTKKWIAFKLNDSLCENILTSLKNILIALHNSWTPRQREICRLYLELNNQLKVGKKLSISQQAVAKTLKAVLWDEYLNGENTIHSILNQIKL